MTRGRGLAMLVPAALLYVLVFILPQGAFLRVSLYEAGPPGQLAAGPTLENYARLITDPFIHHAILETLQLAFVVTVVTVGLAYPIAFAIARSTSFAGNAFFLVAVASMFTSAIVRALGWRVILSDHGVVNAAFMFLGLTDSPVPLVGNFLGVVIGVVHLQIPFAILALMPSCEAVSGQLIQAAYGLGASRWYAFSRIVLPLTLSGIWAAGLLVFALTAGAFTTPTLLSGGRVALLSILIRQQTLQLFNYPVGATIAVLLLAILLPVLVVASIAGSRAVRGYARSA